jgi:single stranded DNA-binding protein
MSSLNKVCLLGNIGKVEVKTFENGKKLVQVSLATSDGYKKGDKWEEKTEWHRCIFAIPALADRAASIQKGDKIYVEGSINTNSWTTKDGEKKEIKEISCTIFKTFVKAKVDNDFHQPTTPVTAPKSNPIEADDDLPFN